MRGHGRLLGTLLAFMATLTVVCGVTGIAYADKYDYTVRVFQGNRGKLSEDPVIVKVAKDGYVKLFDYATADTSGSKYVQIGFRKSGTDEVRINGVVNNITEDMDFVVAYGVQGETVAFTLKFLEYGTGKELASPKTYYGRIGDKPVAAYEYIEGYRPLYRTITGTLKENPDENVWTFEYVALQEGETIETSTTTTNTTSTTTPGNENVNYETTTEPGDVTTTTRTETVPGNTTTQPGTTTDGGTTNGGTTTTPAGTGTTTTTVVPIVTGGNAGGTTTTTTTTPTTTGGDAGGATTATPSGAGGNDAPSNATSDAGGAPAGETGGAAVEGPAPATREILDMDNPLAGPGSDTDVTGSGGNASQAGSRVNPLAVVGILLALAVAGTFGFFFWKRKKDEENEPEPEE